MRTRLGALCVLGLWLVGCEGEGSFQDQNPADGAQDRDGDVVGELPDGGQGDADGSQSKGNVDQPSRIGVFSPYTNYFSLDVAAAPLEFHFGSSNSGWGTLVRPI